MCIFLTKEGPSKNLHLSTKKWVNYFAAPLPFNIHFELNYFIHICLFLFHFWGPPLLLIFFYPNFKYLDFFLLNLKKKYEIK